MHIRKSLWLLLFFLLSLSLAKAERVFILFDQECMDRLEYRKAGQPGSYVVYQVNVASGERIILEVGQEGAEYRGNMPSPVIGCSTGIFDSRLVENINNGMDEVFVINSLSNGRHTITQVSLAGEYQYNQRLLAFDSPEYEFRFDLENGTVGENIAVPGTQREVFFEGRMEEQCLGAYIFRQFAPRSPKPHIDLVFIPAIGIVEERAGFTLEEALGNAVKLESINGIALQYRIQELCNRDTPEYNNSLNLTYSAPGSDVTPAPVYGEAQDMTVKGNRGANVNEMAPAKSATTAVAAQTHNIKAGETLYRLSKKYGVSIGELKAWNGLKSNTIYKGKSLIVSDPSQSPASNLSARAAGPVTNIASANPGSSTPVPYGDNGQRLDVKAKGLAGAQEYHTVRTGETVASIAMKYGYTEARFREMNELEPNEYPKIGQRLKMNDCNCPDLPGATVNTSTPGTINPYSIGANSTTNLQMRSASATTPVNNYSYPASTNYSETGQKPNTNARPFSNYNDIPVPATGTRTAPADYNSSSSVQSRSIYNQPNEYSNTTTNLRGLDNYGSTNRPSGMKRSHIAKEDETLYEIARTYGKTIEQLRKFNRMDRYDVVIPGQKIYLE